LKKHRKEQARRDFLSSEKGTIIKKWGGKIPVCVVFPNTYYIGMSNLATHMLYKTLNEIPDIVCERCFFEEGSSPMSLESRRPLSSFELIFFTISYELDFINVPRILESSSITVNAAQRTGNEPIVVGGGISVMSNPEPVSDFFDIFLMGDIEMVINPFVEKYKELSLKKRDETIEELSTFEWAYNPGHLKVEYGINGTIASFMPADFHVKIKRHDATPLGFSSIITDRTEFSNMFLVEGTRGCPSQCLFCILGNSYEFVYDRFLPIGADTKDIGIIGGGVSFHPHIVEIVKELKEKGKRVHFPSLRIEKIPLSVIELIKDEIKTLTFGIEAGTERLRRSIGKPLKDDEIFDKLEAILAIKPFNLKLYFMIGLYGENIQDIEAIIDLVKHMNHLMIKRGAKRGFVGSITIHASPFVPKPATPFQWLPMNDMDELKDKISRLKRSIAKLDNTYFTHESVKYSYIQGVLARGDRRLSGVVLKFASGENLTRIAKDSAVNLNFFALRERQHDELFPWDFIAGRKTKKWLYKVQERMRSNLYL